MHCLAAYYSELAPSTCTFANQLHSAVALPSPTFFSAVWAMHSWRRRTALRSPESRVWALCGCRRLQCPQETPSGSSVTAGRGTAAALQCSTMQCCPLTRLVQQRTCTCCCFFDSGTNCSMRQTQRAKQLAGFAWDSCSSRLTNEHLPRLLVNSEC